MKFCSNKLPAFTLVELLVTMSIISILAAMSISAYPKFSEQIALTSEAYKALAYFRETQVFGVSALVNPGTKIAYAFLIEKNQSTIKRVVIENPTDISNLYYVNSAIIDTSTTQFQLKDQYEVSEINGINNNSTTSLDLAYVFFKRPNPESRLFGKMGESVSPGTESESFGKIEVIFHSKKNNIFKKKVVILQTGQMYVNDW